MSKYKLKWLQVDTTNGSISTNGRYLIVGSLTEYHGETVKLAPRLTIRDYAGNAPVSIPESAMLQFIDTYIDYFEGGFGLKEAIALMQNIDLNINMFRTGITLINNIDYDITQVLILELDQNIANPLKLQNETKA